MKLTNEDIQMIMEDYHDDPNSKETKLRLLAAFFQTIAPKVGITPGGDVVADLMEWASEAHLEACTTCREFEEKGLDKLFSGSEDK